MAQNDIQISVPIIGTSNKPVAYADQIYDEGYGENGASQSDINELHRQFIADHEETLGRHDEKLAGHDEELEEKAVKFDVYNASAGDVIPDGALLTWAGAPVETRIAEVSEVKTLMVACARTKENNADWPNPKQVRLLTFVLGHSLVATSAANGAKPFNGFQDEDITVAQMGYNGTPQEIYFNTVRGCFIGKTGNVIQGYTYYNSWSNDADYRNNAASNVFIYANGQVASYYRYVENGGYVIGNIINFSQLSADLKEVWGGAQVDISGKADKSEMSITAGTGINADKTTITLKEGTSATVLTQHQDISGKVDVMPGKGLSTNDYTDADKQAVATIGNKANTSDVYNKTEVDNKVDVAVAGAAFLGDEEGEASVADFDPRTDTLWKKEQLLTNTEKAAVKSNLGITQDLAEMRSEIDAQKTAVSMLDGHDLVVVDTLPTSESPAVAPDTDKIYRLVVTNGNDVSYEDYMYTEATTTAVPKKVATYAMPGVDAVPTAGSDNLVKSGGVYADTHLCNIPEVNAFVADIVLKEGVDIDWSHYNRIDIHDNYRESESDSYYSSIRLVDTTGTYPNLKLFSRTTSSEASTFGKLLESEYCYIVVRHVSNGARHANASVVFNQDITWNSLNVHPVIKGLLIEKQLTPQETEIVALQEDVNSIIGAIFPVTISGTCSSYETIWRDENDPIPQGSLIENKSEMPILVYDSYSTTQGEYNYITIPVGKSWTAEYPVYRIKSGNGSGQYSIKSYYPGNIVSQVKDIDEEVDAGFASLNGKVDTITNTLYGGSEELPTITSSANLQPPRIDGAQRAAGYFSRYSVDLTGAFDRGYKKVRFYGFSYTSSGDITQGIVATGVENGAWVVESFVKPVKYQAGYCELPITANSTLLVACILSSLGKTSIGNKYPEGTDVNFVPTTVQLLNEDSEGITVKIDELDTRVTALEEGGGGEAAVKFPATYMPKKVYGVIGDTLQIFRRSVVVSNDPYRQYLDFVCGQGKIYERYLQIIPEKENGVVPTNLTIKHRLIADDYSKSEEQTSNLVLADRPSSSPVSNINVLCIGASTTAGGQWAGELKRRLTGTRGEGTPAADGLSNITFVGRKHIEAQTDKVPVAVNVEATGGWRWYTFYTPQTAFRFYVSGVNSIDIGTNYNYLNSNNETVVVTVAEVNITGNSGNIRCTYNPNYDKKGAPVNANGTLTKRSGSGDATIAYSSYEEETYCPFYDEQTEQPDFAHYASLYCDNQIDVLIAYMGNVNEGIRGDSTDEKIAQVVNNMKTLIDAFHADFPNGKVIVGVAALANPWYGYEYNYSAASNIKTWSLRFSLYRYAKAVETFLQGNDYKDWCFYAGTNTEVDSENGYPTSTKPANMRTSKTDVIGTNGAHPTLEGYQMVADSFYRCFVNTIL